MARVPVLITTNLLLLHKFGVGAVVDNVFSEHGSGERTVDLLRIGVLQFRVEDKVIAFGTDVYSRLLPQENKCKDIAVL